MLIHFKKMLLIWKGEEETRLILRTGFWNVMILGL
jgi:hypothetical protein